jgi:hypothetical protein
VNWWRRQRLPLIALAVTAVAAIGVHVWLDVIPASTRGAHTITMAEPQDDPQAEIAGQTITLDSAVWSEFDAPEGARTLSIRLDARPGADATTCGAFALTEVDGGRVWEKADAELEVPSDAGARGCLEESVSYRILAVFLLPAEAEGPFWFDIPGDDGESARFSVEP